MTPKVCVLCVDAARARFFTMEGAERSTGETVSRLVEIDDLVNPGRRQRPSEALSDSRPGLRQGGGDAGSGHGVDDHRGDKTDESDREFAAGVARAAEAKVRELGATTLVVASSPRMLGWLRAGGISNTAKTTTELDKNLASLSAADLRDQLVEQGVLPAKL